MGHILTTNGRWNSFYCFECQSPKKREYRVGGGNRGSFSSKIVIPKTHGHIDPRPLDLPEYHINAEPDCLALGPRSIAHGL